MGKFFRMQHQILGTVDKYTNPKTTWSPAILLVSGQCERERESWSGVESGF